MNLGLRHSLALRHQLPEQLVLAPLVPEDDAIKFGQFLSVVTRTQALPLLCRWTAPRHSLNLRNQSLCQHQRIDSLVGVWDLRDLGVLAHVVDRWSVGSTADAWLSPWSPHNRSTFDRPFRRAHVRNGRVLAERAGHLSNFLPKLGEGCDDLSCDLRHWHIGNQCTLRDALLVRGPHSLQQRHIEDLCEFRNVLLDLGHWHGPSLLADTVRHELLLNGLHSVHAVLHDLGHGDAQDLLDDLFQSRDPLHQRSVWGLILPYQRRRRCLIFRTEETTAPTSEVGTNRHPPAWRPNKMCSWLSRM